jgi:hypothetical protein
MRAIALVFALASVAHAQPSPRPLTVEDRLTRLELENAQLKAELERLRDDHKAVETRVTELQPLAQKVTGYLDFGFFYATGNGSGIRPDIGYRFFPEYNGQVPDSWVFMGDPLATTVNSRGEPASTSESRALTFDSVNSRGRATFLVNSLTVGLFAGLGENLTFTGAIDLVPRGRDVSDPRGVAVGDFVDVKLAFLEYLIPIKKFSLSLFAGKFDSVLGIEYRIQDSPDRIGVTPSLICRYTCGRPIGLKLRAKFFEEKLIVALAVTNGTSFSEYFPFYNEIDSNFFKTLSGRLSYKLPVGAGLEIGFSGAFGAQDNQTADNVYQWHYGFDAKLEIRDFELAAEFVQGRAEGQSEPLQPACGVAPCLQYMGAYGQIAYRATNWITPYTRVDWRDALHRSGASFVYIADLVRLTLGLRFDIGQYVILKAEYTLVREIGRVPEFPDDVLTTSMVVRY